MGATSHILVIDDEPQVLKIIENVLVRGNYQVTTAVSVQSALDRFAAQSFDLVLIDLVLPDGDGLDIVRAIKEKGDVGIIVVSGLSEATERIIGLELGADDYISKPFEPRELLARVKSVLRRLSDKPSSNVPSQKMSFDDWTLDVGARALFKGTDPVELTSGEFDLLRVLVENAGRVLSRDQIMSHVHGDATPAFDRSIDVKVGRLRKKLHGSNDQLPLIKTVRNVGYMFAAEVR